MTARVDSEDTITSETAWFPAFEPIEEAEAPEHPRKLETLVLILALIGSLLVIVIASGVIYAVIHHWYYFTH